MQLTKGERLLFLMIADIYERLGAQGVDTKLIKEAICTGNTWAIDWQYSDRLPDEVAPAVLKEIVDILDMWVFLERGHQALSSHDKERVERETQGPVRFIGFDQNEESEQVSVAEFLIRRMNRFESFRGRQLNSAVHTLERHRRMLAVFEPIRPTLTDSDLDLSSDQIIAIFKA